MNTVQASLRETTEDQQLVDLVEEITARLQRGEPLDIDEHIARYPEYADKLRNWMTVITAMAELGHSLAAVSHRRIADGGTSPGASFAEGGDRTAPHRSAGDAEVPVTGVLGDFRIVGEIGRGGMGVVYEAEQISLGRRVALKVLPFAAMLDKQQLARFKNEARAAATLDHPNIVAIHSVGSERGVHYYAMQLIEGQSLAQVVEQLRAQRDARSSMLDARSKQRTLGHSPASSIQHPASSIEHQADTAPVAALSTLPDFDSREYYRSVARLGIQAAEALDHAHQNGVLHRDVKPGNLMVDDAGKLWMTDFGLARIEAEAGMTMTGDLVGTLRYMSPEQLRGIAAIVDHRTDVYSLGVTLYEVLTLRPAFTAEASEALMRQILETAPPAPRTLRRAIPVDLETIILKAIHPDPAARYATAKDLADDLERFLAAEPILARRPTLTDRAVQWSRRHGAFLAVSAAALVIVVGVCLAAAALTLSAYNLEATQRTAAEANLEVAAQIIDRMLSQSADDRYVTGDLASAEKLAADAADFYEEILKLSDDPELRFQAAEASGAVAHIWQLVGRHEKAAAANRRAGQLLLRLVTSFPDRPRYHAALAANYNQTGLVDWSLNRPLAAEPSFRQAWEIWTELAERFPNEPTYEGGVAGMLANLGSVCYFSDRFEEAEEYYRRAEIIRARLPEKLKNSAVGLASEAGSITNQAQLARLLGNYDRALELLEASIPLHKQSLEQWPTNPVALDCYFHTLWSVTECELGTRRPIEAAAAIERLVETFPDRLAAYHEGAVQLLRCAVLSEEREGEAPVEPLTTRASDSAGASPSRTYRQRAQELVAKAPAAPKRTSDAVIRFAWFLLMCVDTSFRDPDQARELAKSVVMEVPERDKAWLTLGLAHYRNGDWQAAEDAVDAASTRRSHADSAACEAALMAMIRWRQDRTKEARQWKTKARTVKRETDAVDDDLAGLLAEANELIEMDREGSLR